MLSAEMSAVLEFARANPMVIPESVTEWRALIDAQLSGPLAAGTAETAGILGGRPALWIRPDGDPTANTVLYLHGGAYEVGSIAAYREFASQLTLLLRATVVVLDYRLAPEDPFPAAVDDALAAYRELSGQVAPNRIAVIGDSAGGGLAAALLIALRRAGLAQPAAAVCMSPWTDLTMSAESYVSGAGSDPFLSRDPLARSAASYLAGADPHDPLASPGLAPPDELAGLAPVLIQTGAGEVLADDATALGEHIRAAGGEVQVELWPGVTHVWQLMGSGVPEARDALDVVARFVTTRWP